VQPLLKHGVSASGPFLRVSLPRLIGRLCSLSVCHGVHSESVFCLQVSQACFVSVSVSVSARACVCVCVCVCVSQFQLEVAVSVTVTARLRSRSQPEAASIIMMIMTSGTPSFCICLEYAWYIPCICRCPTYTCQWYIHSSSISKDIPSCIMISIWNLALHDHIIYDII
jgi:hypothetical protein